MEHKLLFKILRAGILLFFIMTLFSCGEIGWKGSDDEDIGNVKKVELYLDNNELQKLYDSVSTNGYAYCTVTVGDSVSDAQIQVRGYTSRMHAKKSFMLIIDEVPYVLERGQSSAGVGNRIAFRTHQLAGLPACNTETVGLFLNDEYLGCYNLIYYYNEDNLDGELYKCYFEDYNHMENNQPLRSLCLKKFPDDDNFSNLETLISALTVMNDSQWQDFVIKNFDMKKLVSYMAVHDFLLVRDTFCTNYYLCYDGKFYFLPWDNESCMGSLSGYEFYGENQLMRRLKTVPEVKAAYNERFKALFLDSGSDSILKTLQVEADQILADAECAIKEDPNYEDEFHEFLSYKSYVKNFLSDNGQCRNFSDPVLK